MRRALAGNRAAPPDQFALCAKKEHLSGLGRAKVGARKSRNNVVDGVSLCRFQTHELTAH